MVAPKKPRQRKAPTRGTILLPKAEPPRDTRFFIAACAIAPLELAIGQSGVRGSLLIGAEVAVAGLLVLAALFWGPLVTYAPGLLGSFNRSRISGTSWLILVLAIAAIGWLADFGSRIGVQPNIFGISHSTEPSASLTLKTAPTELRIRFNLDGRTAEQEGERIGIWAWTGINTQLAVVFGATQATSTSWVLTIVFAEPTLVREVTAKTSGGLSVNFQLQTIDPKYVVLALPGDLAPETIVIRTKSD